MVDPLTRAREALDLMWNDANGYEVKRAAFEDASAALDELEKERLAHAWALRDRDTMIENEHKLYADAWHKHESAQERIRSLESQLAAQPKPLEWRDPETAPNGLLLGAFRDQDGDPFYEIDEMDDTDRENGWSVEKYSHVLMLADLPALPPAQGESDG